MDTKTRLAKKIAESGVASRREAERLIESGRVIVDGQLIKTPVFFVTDKNEISVDGKSISAKSKEIIIWKFYKPKGVVTTKRDTKNRKTVFDFFHNINQRLLYIGRLDYNSEGLLLFTNDGDTARKLELPSSRIKRVYRVRIFGKLTNENVKELQKGITFDGVKYGQITVTFDNQTAKKSSANLWITVTLFEGKNREIRKVMEHFGCTVNRLIRISYGSLKLGELSPGGIVQASKQETMKLLNTL